MNVIRKVTVVLFATSILASCVTTAQNGYETSENVPGLPSNAEWNAMLIHEGPVYSMSQAAGGGMPSEAVWNAVIQKNKDEMQRGLVPATQIQVDIEIGQLLRDAREAIASNNQPKIHEVGAKLEVSLARRARIVQGFSADYARKHPVKFTPSSTAPACANPADPMACARPQTYDSGPAYDSGPTDAQKQELQDQEYRRQQQINGNE